MASLQFRVMAFVFLARTVMALPTSSCSCNGFISREGKGECATRHKGKLWCYIRPEAHCADRRKSQKNTEQSWSYQACQEKNSCSCSGLISNGKGECRTKHGGKLWCYIGPEAGCSDRKESQTKLGQGWSYQACQDKNNEIDPSISESSVNSSSSSGFNVESLVDILGKDVSNNLGTRFNSNNRRQGSSCTTPKGIPGTCNYIFNRQCSDILIAIQHGITSSLISYIIVAIRPPCGFQGFDFTLCCAVRTQPTPAPTAAPIPAPTAAPIPAPTAAPTPAPTQGPQTKCGISKRKKIVGGAVAKQGAWPWAVILGRLKFSGRFELMCGGSLLNRDTILTAAHCIDSTPGVSSATHVRLGDHDITTTNDGATPMDLRIARTIKHSRWNSNSLANDIAIIKLSGSVNYNSNIQPICLPDAYNGWDLSSLLVNHDPTIVGWGSTRTGGGSQDILREASVPVVPQGECAQNYRVVSEVTIDDTKMCAGRGDKDTCNGDSGGALMSNKIGQGWSVVGVTSFGVDCARKDFPGVYTRVDQYLNWIRSLM